MPVSGLMNAPLGPFGVPHGYARIRRLAGTDQFHTYRLEIAQGQVTASVDGAAVITAPVGEGSGSYALTFGAVGTGSSEGCTNTALGCASNLAFLRSLPSRRTVHVDGTRLELLHAAPEDPLFQYLPATRVEDWRKAAAGIDADLVLVGHTHLPVIVDLGGKRMVNPGSVGLPRDGDPRACYAVLEGGEPVLKRVAYDVERTIAALRAWGLPDDVSDSLEHLYRGGEPLSPFGGSASPGA